MFRTFFRRMSTTARTHAERTAGQPRDNTLHTALVTHIARTTPNLRLFTLTVAPTPSAAPLTFQPGQWLDVHTPAHSSPGGFTIISPPSLLPCMELAIQAAPHNPPAAWLWQDESLVVGKSLGVRVGGTFVFPPKETKGVGHVVFVAAGVGVNPLLSMWRHIQTEQKDLEVDFLWSTKPPVADIYMSHLSLLPEASLRLFITGSNSDNTEIDPNPNTELTPESEVDADTTPGKTNTDPNPIPNTNPNPNTEISPESDADINANSAIAYPHERRRMTVEDVTGVVRLGPQDETVVYVCGPPQFSDEFVEGVVAAGLDRGRVFVERWW